MKEIKMNATLEEFFKGDLETLIKNVEEIKNGSFKRCWTRNYSLNTNNAYNRILEYAVELRVISGIINKKRLLMKSKNDKRNTPDILEAQRELISILNIEEK